MTKEEQIVSISNDFTRQSLFVKSILVMLYQIGMEKRLETDSKFDIGFKIGEIYRMLTEYQNNCEELKVEVLELLQELKNTKIINKTEDGSGTRILFD